MSLYIGSLVSTSPSVVVLVWPVSCFKLITLVLLLKELSPGLPNNCKASSGSCNILKYSFALTSFLPSLSLSADALLSFSVK